MDAQQAPGTPLPWRQENTPHAALDNYSYREIVAGSEAYPFVIGEIYYSDTGDEEAEANAAYIVHACNCFPELLEQLEFAVKLLTPFAGGTAQVGAMRDTIAKAKGRVSLNEYAAIAKATGAV